MEKADKNKNFLSGKSVYIIAEIANAAQGKTETNIKLIEEASKAGADAVKLQLYKYDKLATPTYSKYKIYKETFYSLTERTRFIDKAKELGLDVWVDIFDRWGLKTAIKNKGKISTVKIPPTVILDEELVKDILELGFPTAVGVGGYEDKDIDFVLSQISGYKNPIILMYGFQGFPTQIKDTSLARIPHLKTKYGYTVGFADHIDACSELALRMPEYAFFAGASLIEKHITLNRSAKGLDYYSALEPHEFKKMVKNLKNCTTIYGKDRITSGQKDYLEHATRITASRFIKKGELIFSKDIKFRRTDNKKALLPTDTKNYFPALSVKNINKDAGITKKDVKKAKAGVVVVCRLDSQRLPNKALLELNGVPSIERCLLNTLESKYSSMTILATSTNARDRKLKKHTLNGKVKFFRGSEDDPAERMLKAAEKYGLDFIVRVTGDSPFISYELIDFLLKSHFQRVADFSYFKDAPLGVKPEVISTQAIKKLKSLTNTNGYSEYLTLYFKNNTKIFNLNEVSVPPQYLFPEYRLVLDYPEDYKVLNKIFTELKVGKEALPLTKALDFLKKKPEINAVNASIKSKYLSGELAKKLKKITTIRNK